MLQGLLADVFLGGMSIGQIAIAIICIAIIAGIVIIVLRQTGTSVPGWVIQILWLLALGVVAIFAVKFIMSIW